MEEDIDREERMCSSDQDEAIENKHMDDSESDSNMEEDEMGPRHKWEAMKEVVDVWEQPKALNLFGSGRFSGLVNRIVYICIC